MTWRDLTIPQKIHLIQAVWREGISGQQIATACETSKGAILGFYDRNRDALADSPLAMSPRDKQAKGIKKPRTYKQRDGSIATVKSERAKPRLARMPAFPVEPIPVVASDYGLHVTMMDNNGCSWPTNDGGPYTFCGHTRLGLYSYCAVHHERSRGRGTESERRALSGIRANA